LATYFISEKVAKNDQNVTLLLLLLLFIQKHDLFTGIAGMVISIGSKINVYVSIANVLIVIYIS
jgi:hypothetical protein